MTKVAKKTSKATGPKNIAWDAIRAEYVSDDTLTYAVLARKYGVARSTIQKRGKKEEWSSLRKKATENILEDVIENKKLLIADANKRHVEGSKEVQEAILKGVRWINSFTDDMVKGKRKKKVADNVPGTVLFSKALSELVGSYRRAADLERAALGLATGVNKFGDEDGNETPIIFDIMGGKATNGNSSSNTATPAPSSSKS